MSGVPTTEQGLQAERTALAWWRTAVAAMANVVLLLHAAAVSGWRPAAVAPVAAAFALVLVVAVGVRRAHILHTRPRANWSDGRFAVVVVSIAIIAVTCVVAVFTLGLSRLEP
ncbi:hypothetical protein IU474_18320 [Nocardia otitidiscaviarum]|uniref:DUF202 domain-containing protein n=1 Tax=Nocardia otitidiscaviarum TaxID=1823 RepID=UPI001895FC7D|nr:DUF202 domain-containing protein [Nocardia otitidiscaviarum]MBF6239010.1 hypothetical protein [Nocardia otitidiscaviarum]